MSHTHPSSRGHGASSLPERIGDPAQRTILDQVAASWLRRVVTWHQHGVVDALPVSSGIGQGDGVVTLEYRGD